MPPYNRKVTIKGKSISMIPGTKEQKHDEKVIAQGIRCRIQQILGEQNVEDGIVGKMGFHQEYMFSGISKIPMNAIIEDEKTGELWVVQGNPVDPTGKGKFFYTPVQRKQI